MHYRGLQPTDRICTQATQITGGSPAAGRECESTARRCETNYRPTGQRTDRGQQYPGKNKWWPCCL